MVSTLTVITPTIDPEFQNLCQPHTPEELANLRRLIVEAGKCDDILVWNADDYPILDGHTRHLICNGEGIPFGVKLVDLPDREAPSTSSPAFSWAAVTPQRHRRATSRQTPQSDQDHPGRRPKNQTATLAV